MSNAQDGGADREGVARPDDAGASKARPDSTLETPPISAHTPPPHTDSAAPEAQASASASHPAEAGSIAAAGDVADGSSMESAPGETQQVPVRAVIDPRTVRRAPRFGRFAFAGLVVGVVVALLIYQLPIDPMTNARALLVILLILLGGLGMGTGYTVALLLDRRSMRQRPPK